MDVRCELCHDACHDTCDATISEFNKWLRLHLGCYCTLPAHVTMQHSYRCGAIVLPNSNACEHDQNPQYGMLLSLQAMVITSSYLLDKEPDPEEILITVFL